MGKKQSKSHKGKQDLTIPASALVLPEADENDRKRRDAAKAREEG